MGCILGFFYFAWIAIKWTAIGLFHFLKWTLPVWIVFLCFYLGGACGASCASMKDDWVWEEKQNNMQTITIVWNEENSVYTKTIKVRSDMHWNIDGNELSYELWSWEMSDYSSKGVISGNNYGKDGQHCIGFFEYPMGGGEMYATAGGIGLKTIQEDLVLYAAWAR